MPLVGEIELPASQFVLGEVLADVGEFRAELARFVPFRDQFVPFVWVEHDDQSAVAGALGDNPRVDTVTTYEERAGWTLYELTWSGPLDPFLSVLMEQPVLVPAATGTADVWSFELLGSDRDEFAAFQDACRANDLPIEIQSVTRATPEDIARTRLTDKQQRILRAAHDRGYFEVPREVTVSELADELDISPQAASKRLRRALETVVDDAVADGKD